MPGYSPILLLFVLVLTLPAAPATGQTPAGGMHTAPGKPLLVQRPGRASYAPAKAPTLTVLPRYWVAPDSASRLTAMWQLYRFVQVKARYPNAAIRSATVPQGYLRILLRVRADGTLAPPELVQRRLTLGDSAYEPAAVEALEAAAKRIFDTLRFAPAATDTDTVSVLINFRL